MAVRPEGMEKEPMVQFITELGKDTGSLPIGSKARGLSNLSSKGFRVPRTWVVPTDAYELFIKDRDDAAEGLKKAIEAMLPNGPAYAVRSSANVEDLQARSYAGQFDTFLNVTGPEQVSDAVVKVWMSALDADVKAYSDRTGGENEKVLMAVLVQEMVPQVISGVSFSINPVTGVQRPVVEAVKGSGELLVQKGTDTARWEDGLLTGASDGIDGDLLAMVAAETESIRSKLKADIDLEWVYDGEKVWWVQVRPVHKVERKAMYSSRLAKEMLPGQIKPLVWSVNIPLVNGAWVELFDELTGVKGIDPLKLAKAFHYRAYFNMGEVGKIFQHMGLPRESLEIMMSGQGGFKMRMTPRMLAMTPRMLRFVISKLNIRHEIDRFIVKADPYYDSLIEEDLSSLSELALLDRADELFKFNRRAAYYNIQGILFAQMYGRMARKALEKRKIPLDSVNWLDPNEKVLNTYPHEGIEEMRAALESLQPEARTKVEAATCSELKGIPEAARICSMMAEHVRKFGHYSESGNDFSMVPWREDPDVVWKLVLATELTDRNKAGAMDRDDLDLPSMSGIYVRGIGRRYALFSDLRERMSSTYTKGYGIFRRYYIELGKRFSSRGAIEAPEDIFLLYLDEIRKEVSAGPTGDLRKKVAERKEEMVKYSGVHLPEVIFGEEPPPFDLRSGSTFSGIPSSGGYYKGRARVVKGMSDFSKVQKGEVIVIPFSDVSWSTIFARAGAVISESGGMLSHSSIVAREYGIPAVVSVKDAMTIMDGCTVIVDGYTGKIAVEEGSCGL